MNGSSNPNHAEAADVPKTQQAPEEIHERAQHAKTHRRGEKALRRACDTELGAAIMAQVLVGAAGAALMSPQARKLREQARQFAILAAHALSETAQGAASSVTGLFEDKKPRRRSPRKARNSEAAATAH
jgi:hypothetical protein